MDVLIMYVYQFGQMTPRYPMIPTKTPGINSISHHATRWMRQEREGREMERGREGGRGRERGGEYYKKRNELSSIEAHIHTKVISTPLQGSW